MQTVKMVITGPFSAGKTEFIRSISEIEVVSTDQAITSAAEKEVKSATTVAMDFGRITVDDDLAAFIDLLPETLGGIRLRHAIEPRHKSFDDEQFFELCRKRNVAVVLDDSDDYPAIDADTADFAYARLQRMSEEISTGYDEAALDGFAATAHAWQKSGRDAYIFMINGAKVRAPAAALALQDKLGI